ncbi:hypothetical protein ASZ90_007058 [hydrocarbon metagenome]|uniref:Uncharacterized protein n=1 Tax=hydrocarbon metagenome TaxID=938273 RepID=A0A0W8FQL6_9ZZZZ
MSTYIFAPLMPPSIKKAKQTDHIKAVFFMNLTQMFFVIHTDIFLFFQAKPECHGSSVE